MCALHIRTKYHKIHISTYVCKWRSKAHCSAPHCSLCSAHKSHSHEKAMGVIDVRQVDEMFWLWDGSWDLQWGKPDAHVRKCAHGRAGVTVTAVAGNFTATKEWGQASSLCCRSLAVNFHATAFKGDTHAVAFYNPFSLQTLHQYTWLHNNLHSCTGTGQQT